MQKTIYLFDVDGTLVDSIETILRCFRLTFQKININHPGENKIKSLIGSDLGDIFKLFIRHNRVERAIDIFREIYVLEQAKGIPLFPDTKDTLKGLQERGFKMGAVTMKLAKFARPLLDNLGIEQYLEIIIGAENVKNGKPDPEGILKAISHFNTNPDNVVYIGDSLHDAQTAKNAGVDFIGVTTGTTTKEDFHKYGEVNTISSLSLLLNDK